MAASVGSKLKSRLTEEVARNMEAGQSNIKVIGEVEKKEKTKDIL